MGRGKGNIRSDINRLSGTKKANRSDSKVVSRPTQRGVHSHSEDSEAIVYKKVFKRKGLKTREYHNAAGELYNPRGPVREVFFKDNTLAEALYKSESGYFLKTWYQNGQVKQEVYLRDNKPHRDITVGPALRCWNKDGSLKEEVYYVNGVAVKATIEV